MLTVLTRAPAASIVNCELTFIDREPIVYELAQRQHQTYCDLIRQCGAYVITLTPDEDHPDSVFVEDNAVIFDEVAVLTSPGAVSRRGEIERITPEIQKLRPSVLPVTLPATLEGGDVLRNGKKVFVGISTRTNAAGLNTLRAHLAPYGYEVIGVHTPGCLHLKTGCTFIDSETLLVNSDWVDVEAFKGCRLLEVHHEEHFAANSLTINGSVLMTADSPRTMEDVARLGHEVIPVNISEFEKAEAGLTCMSLIFQV